ncbi:MAG: hypothetical protein ACPGQL_04195 [Thermoplasmatota archaeon]
MKGATLLLVTALVAGSLVAIATPTSAVAYCVIGNAVNTGGESCAGVVCIGYSSSYGGWQDCYPELRGCPWQPEYCGPEP